MIEDIVYLFQRGGPFMWGVLGLGVVGFFGCFGAGILFGWRKLLGACMGVLFVALPLVVGLVGTGYGFYLVQHHMALETDPEMLELIRSTGPESAMYPTYFASSVSCLALGLFVVVAAFSAAVASKRS